MEVVGWVAASLVAQSSGLGPGQAGGTTSNACQFLLRPLPKGLLSCSFLLPDNAARKLGEGLGMVRDPGSGFWERELSWESAVSLSRKNPLPSPNTPG